MLRRFDELTLIEPYDVYQRLMNYWDDVMQDDVYLISADGWTNAARPRGVIDDKDRKIKEVPDLRVKSNKYKVDLIPPGLIVGRYFAAERVAIVALTTKHEMAVGQLATFVEEHSGEYGLIDDLLNDQGKITKKALNARLKNLTAGDDEDDKEEAEVLKRCLALINAESEASNAVKAACTSLDQKVLQRYGTLTEAEIKSLVVEDKWISSIRAQIDTEESRLTQHLSTRILELEDRYARPLPEVEREVEQYGEKVQAHLKELGLSWA